MEKSRQNVENKKVLKIVGNLLNKRRKLYMNHEWNSHLEIFSGPEVRENSRQYLLLRTEILHRKQSLGALERTQQKV